VTDFSEWVPRRIYWQDSGPWVDWVHLGARRFTDPFFGQTLDRCLRHPADVLFRHQTPLADLAEIAAAQAGLPPTGFIFHLSRCGSTLISQMLAAAPENTVLSEAAPIDQLLRLRFQVDGLTEERQMQWLRWLVQVLSRPRDSVARHVFIKFDCWHTRFLPLIRRAFPGVPWIFVYREPLEVLVSHANHRGAHMVPGVLEPAIFGWAAAPGAGRPLAEYGAAVLAEIGAAALAQLPSGNGRLVNYGQLPAAVWPALLRFWQVEFSPEATRQMFAAAQLNAKNPVLPFAAGRAAKRQAASAELQALAQGRLGEIYQQLETQRAAAGLV